CHRPTHLQIRSGFCSMDRTCAAAALDGWQGAARRHLQAGRSLSSTVARHRCNSRCSTRPAASAKAFLEHKAAGEGHITQLDRRAFVVATVASTAAPTALGATECPTVGMNWITMSLEARNLAYNNVEHVGPENARKKTEDWAATSKTLREQRPKHLDLAYGKGERNKWDLYPANDPKAPCFVHIHAP